MLITVQVYLRRLGRIPFAAGPRTLVPPSPTPSPPADTAPPPPPPATPPDALHHHYSPPGSGPAPTRASAGQTQAPGWNPARKRRGPSCPPGQVSKGLGVRSERGGGRGERAGPLLRPCYSYLEFKCTCLSFQIFETISWNRPTYLEIFPLNKFIS